MKFFLLSALLCGFGMSSWGQNLYDYQNSKSFADHLYNSRQYNLAISEYERVLYFAPAQDSLKVNLLESYYLAGKIDQGIRRVQELYPDQTNMSSKSSVIYTKMFIANKSLDKATAFLKASNTLEDSDRYILLATISGLQSNWREGKSYIGKASASRTSTQYNMIFDEAIAQKKKSPLLAGALSAIIPGAGKAYSGYWKDGIISFVMIAGAGYQAYQSFSKRGSNSPRGWIFASIATGFYIGNIYGSQKSAKERNHKRSHQYIEKIESTFNTTY